MFRRSGHTDDRRRRVLTEEVVGGAAGRSATAARPSAPGDPSASAYGDAAKLENHCRVSDLIPRRLSIVTLLTALAVAAIGSLVALHHVVATRGAGFQPLSGAVTGWEARATSVAAALDLRHYGSLAAWLSAMMTMGAAVASLLVYSLRRHKQSDYHGRYRIWLWTSLTAVGMSVCAAVPVHEVLAEQVAMRTGWQLPGGMLLLWLIPLGTVLAVVGSRLVLEVRASRLALVALTLAVAAHIAGLIVLHAGRPALAPVIAAMVGVGCQLTANMLLLLGITLFARHVLLDIEGRLPKRAEPAAKPAAKLTAAQAKKAAAEAQANSETAQRKIDPPHASPPAPSRAETAEQTTSRRRREEEEEEQQWYESNRNDKGQRRNSREESDDDNATDDEDGEDNGNRKLSKAERKRLRRLKAQQRANEFN